ncbi:MAG: DedA family protein [Candidatus Marsarchaeota archaeon]|nr:DedA family protein [Candidatus Marsarchaeota archaeon]
MSSISSIITALAHGLSKSFSLAGIQALIMHYGYIAIFGLMSLEAASLPIPSEIVLPAVGYFAAQGLLNVVLAFFVALAAGIIGITVDYAIAYYIGKDVVYKHAGRFHIKKDTLDAFDSWFQKNGAFAVFSLRLVPVLRGLISLPAGFARMPLKTFYLYSILGMVVWNALLMAFGYYALGASNTTMIVVLLSVLGIIMYLIYYMMMRAVKKTHTV